MSGLEQRCQQFHEAALGTGKSKGPAKEMSTLRKFLHKNQDQRLTDKARARLFDTIQVYSSQRDNEALKESQEGLLEDALKMPFTVFTTKQKKTMLKWLEEFRGDVSQAKAATCGAGGREVVLSLIDLEGNKMSLMNDDTGDTHDDVPLPKTELGKSIYEAFHSTDSSPRLKVLLQASEVVAIQGVMDSS